MPLESVSRLSAGVRLGLWRMAESEADFAGSPVMAGACAAHKSGARRLETLCAHALLWQLTGDTGLRICHEASGRPFVAATSAGGAGGAHACLRRIEGMHVSVSHTAGWLAMILSDRGPVAVDIEYVSDRVLAVARRLLRADEPYSTAGELQLVWCAKETAYKLWSDEHLALADMRVTGRMDGRRGLLRVDNMRTAAAAMVGYELTDGYVLATAF